LRLLGFIPKEPRAVASSSKLIVRELAVSGQTMKVRVTMARLMPAAKKAIFLIKINSTHQG
jgi:hypothetical protein